MKILIIKFRNIGDVLLTGPLASSLKLANPDCHISVLVKCGTEAMLHHHPHIDEVIISPEQKDDEARLNFFQREKAWLKGIKADNYDLMINTTEGDRGTFIGFLAGIKQRIGATKPHGDKYWRRALLTDPRDNLPAPRHTVLRNLDLLPSSDVPQHREVHLGFSEEDLSQARALLQEQGWQAGEPLVQVHPTSRWFFKCWDDVEMARVIDHLQSQLGHRAILTSGPDERELDKINNIIKLCNTPPLNLAGQLSLSQTAALSSLCRLFVGVDTAPMHMAAALNIPVIALFGPSGAFDWGPWPNGWQGDDTPYPNSNGVQHQGPHTVIQKDWRCVPCGRDGCDGSKRSRCLEQLSAEDVIPLINQKLLKKESEPSAPPLISTPPVEKTKPMSTPVTLLNRAIRYYLHHSPVTEGKNRLLRTFKPLIKPKAERVITDIKHGFKLMVNLLNPEHERLYFYQDHDERYEVSTLKHIIRAGDTCWDVGANIGFYTCLLAKQVAETGKVFSFEPSSSTMRYLAANVAINCLDNVTRIQKAVGDQVGESELGGAQPDIGEGTASLKSETYGYSETVQVETIDHLSESLPLPDFIKIDVEGFELEVLRGARQFLSKHQPLIMMEIRTRNQEEQKAIEMLLLECGYAFYEFRKHDLIPHTTLASIRRRNVLLANPNSDNHQRITALLADAPTQRT